ncbi:hypothetical protein QS257_17790 [Terrilactibacillus sp. S3-3]|nr:hypothetical protein QS257_17790 [Terrilactibacillus sp. S3-3]
MLKELFAPVTSVEAKRHMSAASFDTIFGVPLVLPLLEGDSQQLYEKYRRILKNERGADDLQLKILAGIDRMIPKFTNEHRLMILYYSGDLSRGNMHLRMLIEDVIPSVAATLQAIIRSINKKELLDIRHFFHVPSSAQKPFYRTETLPTMLSNAYGPGYLWSSIQSVFHKEPIALDRLYRTTAVKLTELANKEDHWGMVDELIFHYMFLTFYDEYNKRMNA